jgi:ribosomal protein S27E
VQVLCGQCGKMTTVADDSVAESVLCAHCGRSIEMQPAKPASTPGPADFRSLPVDDDEGFASAARQAMRKHVYLVAQCGQCGRKLQVSVRQAGKQCRCPSCSKMVRVPFPGEEDQPEVDEPRDPDQQEHEELLVAAEPAGAGSTPPMPSEAPAETGDAGEAPKARSPHRSPQTKLYLVSAAAGIVVAVALLLGAWALWGGSESDAPAANAQPGAAQTEPGPAEPGDGPAAPDDQPPVTPDPTPELKLAGISTGVLMPGRRNPAALGKVYCMATLGLRAGDEAMDVSLRCEDITLETPDGAQGPLALLAGGDWRETPVKRLRLRINPGGYETWTVMLAVERDFEGGRLRVGSLGEVDLQTRQAPDAVEPAGRYAEVPPRHLKPLLRDPVMRAIQNQEQLEINVSPAGADSTRQVELSPVRLAGRAVPVSENTYRVELKGPAGRLECHLRQVDRDTVVLYLSPDRYHQVTLTRLLEEVTATSGPGGRERP